jgi:anthranilate phosphoribosyltransferase
MQQFIAELIERKNLSKTQAYDAMKLIMDGQATPSQVGGFLVGLRMKGETVEEIAGCALAMRDAARPLSLRAPVIVDCCGTGGDGRHSLNVSTAAAFVAAAAGLTVAKHGNRAISSKCGSADVLEALGVKIEAPIAMVEQCLNEVGIGFLFAPAFHPAMRHAMPTRRELGVRTVFNILGPLTNPARASIQLIGVYNQALISVVANVMKQMGHKAGLAVHSNGWDEITLDYPTRVAELLNKRVRTYTLTNRDFGLPKVASKTLAGGDAEFNADAIRKIFAGAEHPARHVIVANAAALIWISERATGQKSFSLKAAVKRAQNAISSGAALKKCEQLADVSRTIE